MAGQEVERGRVAFSPMITITCLIGDAVASDARLPDGAPLLPDAAALMPTSATTLESASANAATRTLRRRRPTIIPPIVRWPIAREHLRGSPVARQISVRSS
jgi:hypothetical protein